MARTRVHDSSSDFDYNAQASDKWLTLEERAAAFKKAKQVEKVLQEAKSKRVISLDISGRKVVDVSSEVIEKQLADIHDGKGEFIMGVKSNGSFGRDYIVKKPMYIDTNPKVQRKQGTRSAKRAQLSRLADGFDFD